MKDKFVFVCYVILAISAVAMAVAHFATGEALEGMAWVGLGVLFTVSATRGVG